MIHFSGFYTYSRNQIKKKRKKTFTLSFTSVLAPQVNKVSTASNLSLETAICSGVRPSYTSNRKWKLSIIYYNYVISKLCCNVVSCLVRISRKRRKKKCQTMLHSNYLLLVGSWIWVLSRAKISFTCIA